MLEFVNYFFSLFTDFMNMLLYEMELDLGLTIGELLVGVLIIGYVLAFLYKGWVIDTFPTAGRIEDKGGK